MGVVEYINFFEFFQYGERFNIPRFYSSLPMSSVSRFFLLSSVIYSLKDIADTNIEENLNGSKTYIYLNYMVGIWAFVVCIGQILSPYRERIEMLALSMLFLTKGYRAQALVMKPPEEDDNSDNQNLEDGEDVVEDGDHNS